MAMSTDELIEKISLQQQIIGMKSLCFNARKRCLLGTSRSFNPCAKTLSALLIFDSRIHECVCYSVD
jgi:hypothetical protein